VAISLRSVLRGFHLSKKSTCTLGCRCPGWFINSTQAISATESNPESSRASSGAFGPAALSRWAIFVDAAAGVEAGRQRVAVDEENLAALDRLVGERQGEVNAPIQDHLEQQVFGAAVGFDVREARSRDLQAGASLQCLIHVVAQQAVDVVDEFHAGYPKSCATRRIGKNNRLGWACRVKKPKCR
jgi:hypothetical protein